jgi:ribosome maturation factor RimP
LELARPLEGQRRFRGTITGESDGQVTLLLNDQNELVAGIDEMVKASLILTDKLIEAARADGSLPPQPDETDLAEFEIDETQEHEDTLEQE